MQNNIPNQKEICHQTEFALTGRAIFFAFFLLIFLVFWNFIVFGFVHSELVYHMMWSPHMMKVSLPLSYILYYNSITIVYKQCIVQCPLQWSTYSMNFIVLWESSYSLRVLVRSEYSLSLSFSISIWIRGFLLYFPLRLNVSISIDCVHYYSNIILESIFMSIDRLPVSLS